MAKWHENEDFPNGTCLYDTMYRNLLEGRNSDGSEVEPRKITKKEYKEAKKLIKKYKKQNL